MRRATTWMALLLVACGGDGRRGTEGDAGRDAGPPDAGEDAGIAPSLCETEDGCGAVEVSAGALHTCARRASGRVICWGRNDESQIDATDAVVGLANIEGVENARLVVAGPFHTLASTGSGEVVRWGSNGCVLIAGSWVCSSACDPDDADACIDEAPRVLSDLGEVVDLTSGHQDCALEESGDILCWTNDAVSVPTRVEGVPPASDVSAGGSNVRRTEGHTCAVAAGEVWCWGDNSYGQLGDGAGGTGARSDVPVRAIGITDAVQVEAGGSFTCVREGSGRIQCWGRGDDGQIGDGLRLERVLEPTPVPGISDATDIDLAPHGAGTGSHACALRSTGEVMCWGDGTRRQVDADSEQLHPTPVVVPGVAEAVDVATARDHSCAALADGRVLCWGEDHQNRLGAEGAGPQPVAVRGIP